MDERDAAAVRERLLSTHEPTIRRVLDCADAVAATWDEDGATDRAAVAEPLERALEDAGVLERLPDVLASAVAALGAELPAEPVAQPPYVAVTSRGPMVRATLSAGRLVVTIRAFRVERDPGIRYVRDAESPAAALVVECR